MFPESAVEGSLYECYWCVVLFSAISSSRDGKGTNERQENKRIKDVVWPTLSSLRKKIRFAIFVSGFQKVFFFFFYVYNTI